MPIRRRITKHIPPPIKVPGARYAVGEFYVLFNKNTRRFHLYDARVAKPKKKMPPPIGEGFAKLPIAKAAADSAAERAYL